jgi:hypothetical protein
MNSFSPTSHGFRLAFRCPSIPLAEIVWRWSFTAAAFTLGWLFFREYFAGLPVNRVDRLLLASNQPILISRALHRIFSGSAFRFTEAGVLVALALVIAWIALASLGRVVTVNAIVDELDFGPAPARAPFGSLVSLNFLRAAVALAAIAGAIGAIFISSSFWSSTHISVESASRLFFLTFFATWLAWCILNWFLSLSIIFVVTETASALSSMAESISLLQRRPGPIIVTGILFGLIHLGAFLTATSAAFVGLSSLSAASPALAWLSQFVVIAAYCAFADFLYTARMSAYVFIMRAPEPVLVVATPTTTPLAPISTSIDPDELILSDVPLPAT